MRADDKELLRASILYTLYKTHEDERNIDDTPVSDQMLFDICSDYATEDKVRAILREMVKKEWVDEIDYGGKTGMLFYRIKRQGEEEYEQKEAVAY